MFRGIISGGRRWSKCSACGMSLFLVQHQEVKAGGLGLAPLHQEAPASAGLSGPDFRVEPIAWMIFSDRGRPFEIVNRSDL